MSIETTGRSVAWILAGVVLVAAVLFVTRSRQQGPEYMVVRAYDVKPEIAAEMTNALRTSVGAFGQVTLSPSGQILVTAMPSMQAGVGQMLKDVESRKPAATPAIRFEAWLVAASPGDPVDAPNLKEIEPALNAVKESKGRMRFELLEKLSTQARAGHKSEIRGQHADMEVDASLRTDSKDQPMIAARIKLGYRLDGQLSNLESQTELRPGELLVIGQSGLADKSIPDRELYYIVRAAL